MYYMQDISSQQNLRNAFRHVAARHGGAGVDGITLEYFHENLDRELEKIEQQLQNNHYPFQPAMAIELKQRMVYVLTVGDRVVTQAMAQVLSFPFEKCFHSASYAYRANRSAVGAAIALQEMLQSMENPYVVRCDVQNFFDEIDHRLMLEFIDHVLESPCNDTKVLMEKALKQPCLEKGQARSRQRGVCQGSPLSPLLSNLYLSPLDRYLEKAGCRHLRFCDDIAVIAESMEQAKALYHHIEHFMKTYLALRFRQNKTKIVRFSDGIDFLGFHLSPKGRFPGKKACNRLQNRLEQADQSERKEVARRWEAYYGKGSADKILEKNSTYQPLIISLFQQLFRGNPHCFAKAYSSPARYGYVRVDKSPENQDFLEHIIGNQTMAIYPLYKGQAAFTCLDLDLDRIVMNTYYHNDSAAFTCCHDRLLQYTRDIQKLLNKLGMTPLLEDSGLKGFHLWLFFDKFVAAEQIIAFWHRVLHMVGPVPKNCRCEIFPRESRTEGPGACIKLPLAVHPKSGCRSMFLDEDGEVIANPESLLANVDKLKQKALNLVNEKDLASDSPIGILLNKCNVVRILCQKATQEKHLAHVERLILLYTLGQLGTSGVEYLHDIIAQCDNYSRNYTQRQVNKKHPSPMGCRRIQEMMGDSLNNIECQCRFAKIPARGYASPILHIYPEATKNLGGKRQ